MPTFIIEHLEERPWKWCLIEYKHISEIVGKGKVWFTNIKCKELANYGRVVGKSVSQLSLKNACILDPHAKKTLTPREAKRFNYLIFGGILGDNPPRGRTRELTKRLDAAVRNLGRKQLSTDNAVYVAREVCKGAPVSRLKFKENVEVKLSNNSSVIFPFRYIIVRNKPLISKELITYLKRRRGF